MQRSRAKSGVRAGTRTSRSVKGKASAQRLSTSGKLLAVCGGVGLVLGLISQVRDLVGPFAATEKQAAVLAILVVGVLLLAVALYAGWRRSAPTQRFLAVLAGLAVLAVGLGAGFALGRKTISSEAWRYQIAANRMGVPTFADTAGTLAPDKARIPYGMKVRVQCKVKNSSGLTPSVTAWYLILSPPWQGLYAPSDTFSNGDLFGSIGATSVDPDVPDC